MPREAQQHSEETSDSTVCLPSGLFYILNPDETMFFIDFVDSVTIAVMTFKWKMRINHKEFTKLTKNVLKLERVFNSHVLEIVVSLTFVQGFGENYCILGFKKNDSNNFFTLYWLLSTFTTEQFV